MRRIISCIPNTITLLNLISGCIATIFAFRLNDVYCGLTGAQWAYISIAAAALFDFCDGLSARLLRAYSPLGKELDSLSDMVSFGVAPGLLMFNTMTGHGTCFLWAAVAMLIPAMGALRLAKFNIDETQSDTFTGLPIPANALFWIGMSAFIARYGYPHAIVMSVIIVLISLAMVSRIRMFSLKFKTLGLKGNIKRYFLLAAAVVLIVTLGISGLVWTILLYLLISIFAKKA